MNQKKEEIEKTLGHLGLRPTGEYDQIFVKFPFFQLGVAPADACSLDELGDLTERLYRQLDATEIHPQEFIRNYYSCGGVIIKNTTKSSRIYLLKICVWPSAELAKKYDYNSQMLIHRHELGEIDSEKPLWRKPVDYFHYKFLRGKK